MEVQIQVLLSYGANRKPEESKSSQPVTESPLQTQPSWAFPRIHISHKGEPDKGNKLNNLIIHANLFKSLKLYILAWSLVDNYQHPTRTSNLWASPPAQIRSCVTPKPWRKLQKCKESNQETKKEPRGKPRFWPPPGAKQASLLSYTGSSNPKSAILVSN